MERSREKTLTDFPFPAYNLFEVFGLTRGNIYCSNCNRVVIPQGKKKEISCQRCGHPNVYIRFKWQSQTHRIYEDKTGRSHSYSTAILDLAEINKQIHDKQFDPQEWLPETIEGKKFGMQMTAWLARKEKETADGKLAPSTLRDYKSYAKNYFPYFNALDVREIKMKNLQLFYDGLPAKGLSPKYVKNIMDALHTFFRWLVRWGEIEEVPTWPEMEEAIVKQRFALTLDEQKSALANIPAVHRDIIEFAMETGLRPAEVCALMTIDVDWKRGIALIRRTYSEGKLRNKTKQKKEQWIPLSDRACELIENNQNDTGFVFKNPVTRRGYLPEFLRRVWVNNSKTSVELYEATRHSFCTQIVEDGVSELQAQRLMRHTDSRSTGRYYHPTGDRMRDIVNRRGRKVIKIEEARK